MMTQPLCPYCKESNEPVDGCVFVDAALADRLTKMAAEYKLEAEPLIQWADKVILKASMLGTVASGRLDIVGFNSEGEYLYRSAQSE